jgi:hypothetical protein
MTDAALLAAILADPTAKAMADAGNDSGVAARIASLQPPDVVSRLVDERGVYNAFPNPSDALAVMTGLATATAGNPSATPPVPANPILLKVLEWMTPPAGGVDVGNAAVRAQLDSLQASGVLTPASVATLKALAEQPAFIDYAQVSRVLAASRTGGNGS